MLDARALVNKHRGRGAIVDTNLLVLLLVGAVNKQRIPAFKRTQSYTVEDFELLARLTKWFGTLICTPHVLAQASGLTDLSGVELRRIRTVFRQRVLTMDERFDPAGALVEHPLFDRLGLTDAAVAAVCERGALVMTADVNLYVALVQRGGDALNFNHVRPLGWR